jgi:NitT/TauT family transport system permease protein
MRQNSPPINPGGAHDAEIAGIDALEIPIEAHPPLAKRLWRATWPVLVAVGGFLLIWQLAYLREWRPHAALPSPLQVWGELQEYFSSGDALKELRTTSVRALYGYAAAFGIGIAVGLFVVGSRVLRAATGSFITGLQTMPSIAWFPLAILFFGINESAILFVMILGAAPAIANGLISAVDQIPPILLSAGRVLGATGVKKYRHVIIPASLPSFVGGMKQGWAFLWRSLMAGELLVIIANKPSLGQGLQFARELADAKGLIARMILILLVGIFVDRLFFARIDHAIRVRWGLGETV